MAISDPIADMLTRIRNAVKAKHSRTDVPGSKLKTSIAKILREEGYIRKYEFFKDGKQGILRIYFKAKSDGVYQNGIVKIDRVSKPGRRIYCKASKIKRVLNGTGIAILSTSRGLMTDKDAVKSNLGGEVLCTVW